MRTHTHLNILCGSKLCIKNIREDRGDVNKQVYVCRNGTIKNEHAKKYELQETEKTSKGKEKLTFNNIFSGTAM